MEDDYSLGMKWRANGIKPINAKHNENFIL